MIEIDGSFGEGGGQIIRSTLSLATIMGQAVHIRNIRAKRDKPGLMPQHLMAVIAAGKICGAKLKNATLRSSELCFFPNTIEGGIYRFDVGTAGSAVMVAQTILPPLLFANRPSHVQIVGGTHVPKSPSYDYFKEVFNRAIICLGAQVQVKLNRAGYFPQGGGQIEVLISPSKLNGSEIWPRETTAHGVVRVSNLPRHIAERESNILKQAGVSSVKIYEDPAHSQGNSLTLWRGFCGSCVLGQRGKLAETVAEEAVKELESEDQDVDRFLADQLLIYAALAQGKSSFSTSAITMHLKTNAFVIETLAHRKVNILANRVEIQS